MNPDGVARVRGVVREPKYHHRHEENPIRLPTRASRASREICTEVSHARPSPLAPGFHAEARSAAPWPATIAAARRGAERAQRSLGQSLKGFDVVAGEAKCGSLDCARDDDKVQIP